MPPEAAALESIATPVERAAAGTVPTERDLLIKLIARDIGTVTGGAARRCARRQLDGSKLLDLADPVVVRGPAAFTF